MTTLVAPFPGDTLNIYDLDGLASPDEVMIVSEGVVQLIAVDQDLPTAYLPLDGKGTPTYIQDVDLSAARDSLVETLALLDSGDDGFFSRYCDDSHVFYGDYTDDSHSECPMCGSYDTDNVTIRQVGMDTFHVDFSYSCYDYEEFDGSYEEVLAFLSERVSILDDRSHSLLEVITREGDLDSLERVRDTTDRCRTDITDAITEITARLECR